jgi:hypothetical protein
MTITGTLHRVTDPGFFTNAFLGAPLDPATFAPWGPEDAVLAQLQIGIDIEVLPFFELDLYGLVAPRWGASDARGNFEIDTSGIADLFAAHPGDLRLVLYHRIAQPSHRAFLPTNFGPCYRSAEFSLDEATAHHFDAYVYLIQTDSSNGITQAQINDAVQGVQIDGVDSLQATIHGPIGSSPGGLNVVATASDVTASFDLMLTPSTSPDLQWLLDYQLGPISVDIPWYEALCVSEDDVRQSVTDGIGGVALQFNKDVYADVKNDIATAAGVPEDVVDNFIDSRLTTTFDQIQYPTTPTTMIPGMGTMLMTTTLAPGVCLGYPQHI